MKAVTECIPCSLKQIINVRKHIPGFTEAMEEEAVQRALRGLSEMHWPSLTPAEVTEACIAAITHALGDDDPFREAKVRFNETVAGLLPLAREIMSQKRGAKGRLHTALLLAAAGNIIDPGIVTHMDVAGTLRKAVEAGFRVDHAEKLFAALGIGERPRGKKLLYIADNAGEIVLDALAVELLAEWAAVTVVVRGGPILNDAMEEDALFAGISRFAAIMTTGCSRLGILEGCSPEFQAAFRDSDIVISKGHANYETIEENRPGVFFLLTAKCRPVARRLGVEVGDTVFVEAI